MNYSTEIGKIGGSSGQRSNWQFITESGAHFNQTRNPPYSCISLLTGLVLKTFNNNRTGISITKICTHSYSTTVDCIQNQHSAVRKTDFYKQ